MALSKEKFLAIRQNKPKGAKNKTLDETRQLFKKLLDANLETLQDDLNELEPKDRVRAILDLAKFVVPQMKQVEHSGEIDNKFQPIIVQL
jgi:hypothetical protein